MKLFSRHRLHWVPQGVFTLGIVDSADFSKRAERKCDTNKAWSHAQCPQSSTSFWKTWPCFWRDKDLKLTRQTRDNREVKGPIGSGHGHMTRPQAIPKRLPALVFSSARWPACRGLLMRSCREKKSRHCSGTEESIGYLSKGALSGIWGEIRRDEITGIKMDEKGKNKTGREGGEETD